MISAFSLNTEYKIVSATSYNPAGNLFARLNDAAGTTNYSGNALHYSLRYAADDGVYLTITFVPEPGSAVSLFAISGVLLRRKHRAYNRHDEAGLAAT